MPDIGELDTVAKVLNAFYRLVGSQSSDAALAELGEQTDEVAYMFLTRGCRAAQLWMVDAGYAGWRKRSPAITSWSGTDAADGGRYTTLPSDFLRAVGGDRHFLLRRQSALREADGKPWGEEVDNRKDTFQGNGYYLEGDKLWLLRRASPPATLYLFYTYAHPVWSASVTIDFPLTVRSLVVAEAADAAKEESWLLGGADLEAKIERNLIRRRSEAWKFARRSRSRRDVGRSVPLGTHW